MQNNRKESDRMATNKVINKLLDLEGEYLRLKQLERFNYCMECGVNQATTYCTNIGACCKDCLDLEHQDEI